MVTMRRTNYTKFVNVSFIISILPPGGKLYLIRLLLLSIEQSRLKKKYTNFYSVIIGKV